VNFVMDAAQTERIAEFLSFTRDQGLAIDTVLVAYGTLPDQTECDRSLDLTLQTLAVNGTSAAAWMAAWAEIFAARGRGTLAVIGSPAGDRGRASNYTYGAAKAMVHTFAEGLRHRLSRSGVRVVLLKLGFVDTPMTARFDKRGPLWRSAADVGRDIVTAIDRAEGTVYVPGFWRYIMLVIRHVPWFIFRRMSI
jgi:decaprenylphospho-beta-D-erythro-pentofuranosid-2-ulose 2-reductase